MAQNYLEFSEEITDLTHNELDWWKKEESRIAKAWDTDPDAYDQIDNCNDFEIRGNTVWFHSEEDGDLDKVAHIIGRFFKECRPDGCFGITWSESCSKSRVGEFGGGALFVTGDTEEWLSPQGWLVLTEKIWRDKQ